MEEKKELSINQKQLDIAPISKGRRMLVYLGDLFICFIISIFLFNIVVLPIGKASMDFYALVDVVDQESKKRDDVLYGNEILFFEDEEDKYNFNSNLYYTGNKYVEYLVFENEIKYDVFNTYFNNIRHDDTSYISIIKELDKNLNFFEFNGNQVKLKQVYKDEFKPAFDEQNEMSNQGKKDYAIFLEDIYLKAYSRIFEDILQNDLTYEGISYNSCQKVIKDINKQYDLLVLISTFIAYFLSGIICYLIYPLINKNGKTMTMSIMKIERVGINNIYLLKKGEVALSSIYNFVSNMTLIMFLPLPNILLSYIFAIGNGSLLVLSLLSFGLVSVSFFVILFNQYNRSLFDILSRTVMISSESLDEIYRLKGYDI